MLFILMLLLFITHLLTYFIISSILPGIAYLCVCLFVVCDSLAVCLCVCMCVCSMSCVCVHQPCTHSMSNYHSWMASIITSWLHNFFLSQLLGVYLDKQYAECISRYVVHVLLPNSQPESRPEIQYLILADIEGQQKLTLSCISNVRSKK